MVPAPDPGHVPCARHRPDHSTLNAGLYRWFQAKKRIRCGLKKFLLRSCDSTWRSTGKFSCASNTRVEAQVLDSSAEISFADMLVVDECFTSAGQYDRPCLKQIRVIAHIQRRIGVLFYHQDRRA